MLISIHGRVTKEGRPTDHPTDHPTALWFGYILSTHFKEVSVGRGSGAEGGAEGGDEGAAECAWDRDNLYNRSLALKSRDD